MYIKLILITSWIIIKVNKDVIVVAKTNHHQKWPILPFFGTKNNFSMKILWEIKVFIFSGPYFEFESIEKFLMGPYFPHYPIFCLDIWSSPWNSQLGTVFACTLFEVYFVLSHSYFLETFFFVYRQIYPKTASWASWYLMKLLEAAQNTQHFVLSTLNQLPKLTKTQHLRSELNFI